MMKLKKLKNLLKEYFETFKYNLFFYSSMPEETKAANSNAPEDFSKIENQPCPMCLSNSMTLMEFSQDVPFFGTVYIISMQCTKCKYRKSDIEPAEKRDPARYTLEITCEEDMNIRVVRSSEATVKIPRMASIEPGAAANGFVTNVEGLLNRIKVKIEHLRDGAEDNVARKKAKNMLKKLQNVMWGKDTMKLIIEDPTGNSAIISEKAEIKKLKK